MKNSKILIVDSSVALKWLHQVNEENIEQADLILDKAEKEKITLVMPLLAKYEIGNSLLYKHLELSILLSLIERFYVLPIEFVPEDLSLSELTMEIAFQNKITYYDASFIALAKKMEAPLVTDNPKHHGKYKEKTPKIIALKDFR